MHKGRMCVPTHTVTATCVEGSGTNAACTLDSQIYKLSQSVTVAQAAVSRADSVISMRSSDASTFSSFLGWGRSHQGVCGLKGRVGTEGDRHWGKEEFWTFGKKHKGHIVLLINAAHTAVNTQILLYKKICK